MQKRTLKNSDVKNNTTNNIATISLNHFTILLNISGYCLYMGFDNSLFAFFGTKVQDIILVILKKVFRKYSRAFCLAQNIEVFFPIRIVVRIIFAYSLTDKVFFSFFIQESCQFISLCLAFRCISAPSSCVHPFCTVSGSIAVDRNKNHIGCSISSANFVYTPCTF